MTTQPLAKNSQENIYNPLKQYCICYVRIVLRENFIVQALS